LRVVRLEDRRLLSAGLTPYLFFPSAAGRLAAPGASTAAAPASAPAAASGGATATAAAPAAAPQAPAYPAGGYASWSIGSSLVGVKFDPGIVGINLHVPWDVVQTGPTSYNWAQLDARLHEAQAMGLKVTLMLIDGPTRAPSFVVNDPAVQTISFIDTIRYHKTYGQMLTGPVLWDPTYLADRVAFIKAVGARYANSPDVVAVTTGGANWYTDDWKIPDQSGPVTIGTTTYNLSQPAQWLAAGYTNARIEATVHAVMDATAAAFPRQYLKLEIGVTTPALSGSVTGLVGDALNYGYTHYGDRVVAQVNYLSAVSPTASVVSLNTLTKGMSQVLGLLDHYQGPVGVQMLGQATDGVAGNYRDNGGQPAPDAVVLQNALNIGLTYKPMFIEYWAADATNPAFAGIIQSASTATQANPGTAATNPSVPPSSGAGQPSAGSDTGPSQGPAHHHHRRRAGDG
jgi:hypothetical protein